MRESDGDENDIESKAENIKFPAIDSKKHGIISTTMQKDVNQSSAKARHGATQGPFGL
jgi:hypothetical protein